MPDPNQRPPTLVLARLERVLETGEPVVRYRIQDQECELVANSLVPLSSAEVGSSLAVWLTEEGQRPMVAGRVVDLPRSEAPPGRLVLDAQALVIEAREELVLRCGSASITLSADGKIVIQGDHLLQRARGPIRIKGACVDIN